MPASLALCSRVAAGSPANPSDRLGDSVTTSAEPVNTGPCSNSRTSRTSRFRLCASIAIMPGAIEKKFKGVITMKTHWQILVVDDEEVMCESLAAWLREDGYRSEERRVGKECRTR